MIYAIPARGQRGVSMIEVLVALVILMVGLLGLAGLQTRAQQAEMESYQRAQALILLKDMVDRINANRSVVSCYAITDNTSGTPHLGTGYTGTPTCSAGTTEQQTTAVADLAAWNDLLKGATEVQGTSKLGAMIGARGCVSLLDSATNTYLVTVAWQGLGPTNTPPNGLKCGTGQYPSEAHRHVVSGTLRIGTLM